MQLIPPLCLRSVLEPNRLTSLTDIPFDLFSADTLGVVGIFKLGQTCRTLEEATSCERRALGGRMVVYMPQLPRDIHFYMTKYLFKDAPSAVETMVYWRMLEFQQRGLMKVHGIPYVAM